jgi:hypothetical protein
MDLRTWRRIGRIPSEPATPGDEPHGRQGRHEADPHEDRDLRPESEASEIIIPALRAEEHASEPGDDQKERREAVEGVDRRNPLQCRGVDAGTQKHELASDDRD